MFVLVDVQNVGQFALGHNGGDGRIEIRIAGVDPAGRPNACAERGIEAGSVSGVDHPGLLAPGQATSFKHLLKGYRLTRGSYELRVTGTVDVSWPDFCNVPIAPGAPPRPRPQRKRGEPVDGDAVDATLPITIEPATEEALRAAYAPLVRAAEDIMMDRHALAAIYEMAPPFLADTIAKFAADPTRGAAAAYGALAEINSSATRAALRRLYDETPHLGYRNSIADALRRTGAADNFEFFSSLLPGRSTDWDDRIRATAVGALRCIGGDAAAQALIRAPRSPNPSVHRSVLFALGDTRSRLAVPALIELAAVDHDARSNVCGPLRTLTHHDWCVDEPDFRSRWKRWWRVNGARVPIHSPNERIPEGAALPIVR